MIKRLLNPGANCINWLVIIRVITGVIIAKYGTGVFSNDHMKGNIQWLTDIHFPLPVVMAYIGKGAELVGGIFIILGLLTRFWCFVLIIDMAVVVFIMGHAKIFGDDQLPFLLALLFITFAITGGGKWSLDRLIFDRLNK